MKTQDELGAGRFFEVEALHADGHASMRFAGFETSRKVFDAITEYWQA
ncbi:MAG TPA: hypothetical protein VKJ65_02670 [Phycisphaerae bacterium]|nr:hypothetical protein [Phycisphaerae bacterium]